MPVKREGDFVIEGKAQLEGRDTLPGDLKLHAYAFDRRGKLLGSEVIGEDTSFSLRLALDKPADVELYVGPAVEDPQRIRMSSAYSQHFSAQDWAGEAGRFRLSPSIFVPTAMWWPWRPQRICVSGHVRKIETDDGHTTVCPVPYVKVEIFDVDREGCFWPFIRRWWDVLLDRPVFRIPDLLRERPFPPRPFPGPDPAPDIFKHLGERVGLNPQPLPPHEMAGFNPQPEPPGMMMAFMPSGSEMADIGESLSLASAAASTRVGEARMIAPGIASHLENLTLTSIIAPWFLFPRCFYSRELVCETYTDCDGYFQCCFDWWPFHFRRGRLRFDSRPDIIIRVTQIINGVETVLYMDPYTSTRWNVTNAHIDLYLDNDQIQCGSPDCGDRPEGAVVFFTRIGDDEVYQINQANGEYEAPPYTNVAYGGTLYVYGQFGDDLSDGSPARYYRLSYAKQGSSTFTPITAGLSDTRVNKGTLFSDTHTLGPQTVNGVPALYEVRNFDDYYWYNPDWIGTWHSWLAEEDTGAYILRLEVFDENGVKMTSAQVDYRDGTVTPPAVLPPMLDRCDLVITLDNKAPNLVLLTPATNECGVIPWSPSLVLNFNVTATQENSRLLSWALQYKKGAGPYLPLPGGAGSSTSGGASVSGLNVSGAPLLVGLSSTCAFALRLSATAHVRDGRQFIFYREDVHAIAIEKC